MRYEGRGENVRPSGYRNQEYNFEQGEPSGNKGGEISKKQVESNNPENVEQRRENASSELKSLDMSYSSSASSRRRSPEKGSENINSLGDDSLIALSLGNEEIKDGCKPGMEPNRHLGENEMKGCEHGVQAKNINDKILPAERTVIEQIECAADVVEKEERWGDVAKKRLYDEDDEVDRGVEVELGENMGPVSGIQNNVFDRALDDLRCMGFQLRESNSEYIEPSNNNGKSSWELAVDKLNEKIDN
ncbi:hypothetical protein V6N11_022128 [Hibiscus sabdariffa]|uniref:Uncharacterized protein n=1 Tax=Hibiscus sabdariffa TaxID=183260 RepID=A0ABR2TJ05_9ROSI